MSKEKIKDKIKTISLRPFPYEVKVVVTKNIRAYEKRIRDKNNDTTPLTADKNTGGLTMTAHNLRALHLILPPGASINAITHETTHVVRKLSQFVGAKFESEIVAYYTGWLVEEVAKFVYANTDTKKLTKTALVGYSNSSGDRDNSTGQQVDSDKAPELPGLGFSEDRREDTAV
jgi:hypothetical protein